MQQTNLLSVQQSDNASVIVDQIKVQNANESISTESLLPIGDDILSDKQKQAIDDNYAKDKSVSMTQNVCKKSPGRPKKIGITSQVS
jgi:hypothetical protein